MKTAFLLSGLLALALAPSTAWAEVLAACRASPPERPARDGLRLEDVASQPGDLPAIRATHVSSGAHMLIYYDAASEPAARARAACLGAQLGLLEEALDDDRRDAEWDSVVFTVDPDYAPPRAEGRQSRWSIHLPADGALNEAAERFVSSTMPHELTHDWQGRYGGRSPRWFHEGHATWVGSIVTAQLDAVTARSEAARHQAALADAEPLRLSAWGGVQVKPEAILRQLSPEDRARQLADPSYLPKGPFSFGPDDMISDESNTPARYAGALRIFEGLEQRHGAAAVRAWVGEVTAREGRISTADIIASGRERFGEDLTPLLD